MGFSKSKKNRRFVYETLIVNKGIPSLVTHYQRSFCKFSIETLLLLLSFLFCIVVRNGNNVFFFFSALKISPYDLKGFEFFWFNRNDFSSLARESKGPKRAVAKPLTRS